MIDKHAIFQLGFPVAKSYDTGVVGTGASMGLANILLLLVLLLPPNHLDKQLLVMDTINCGGSTLGVGTTIG